MTDREERVIVEALFWFQSRQGVALDPQESALVDACQALLTERAARLPKPSEVDIIRDSPNDVTLRPEFDQRTGKRRMG